MENQYNERGFSCRCEKCGHTLYDGEMLNIKGRFVCEPCAEGYVFGGGAAVKKRRAPSPFFHFMCSFIPGAGQMYLGLMKRGLFQMCLFFSAIYLTAAVMPEFFGFVIPIIFFYSFFDSISLRRRIAAGETVSDDLNGVSQFLSSNRRLIAIVLIIMLATGFIHSFFGMAAMSRNNRFGSYSDGQVSSVSVEIAEGARAEIVSEAGPVMERTITYYDGRRGGSFAKSVAPIMLIVIGGLIVVKSAKRKKAERVEILDPAGKADSDDYGFRNNY